MVNRMALGPRGPGLHPYWVATLGKLFTHIASPVLLAPRNYKREFSDWIDLTA